MDPFTPGLYLVPEAVAWLAMGFGLVAGVGVTTLIFLCATPEVAARLVNRHGQEIEVEDEDVSSASGASVRGNGPAVTLASGGAASDAPRLSLHRADVPRVVVTSVSSARGPGNEPAERPAPGCSSPLAFPGPRAMGTDDFVQVPGTWRAR